MSIERAGWVTVRTLPSSLLPHSPPPPLPRLATIAPMFAGIPGTSLPSIPQLIVRICDIVSSHERNNDDITMQRYL